MPDETFFGYCEASRHYFERYGKPVAFYSDKHGIFRVNQPRPLGLTSGLTQFGRAMQELDVQIICANTPQAKGRIERANQTLQDRLVKELRLRGISDIETANAFLPEFRADYNRRFAVAPRSSHDAHRPLLKNENLDLILTHQKTGTLSKNLTVQSNKVIYQIQSNRPDYALRNAQVTVCENAKGDVTILYKNKPLSYTIFHKSPRQAEVVDTKTLDRQIKTLSLLLIITPGVTMVLISMANPSTKPLPMPQTEVGWLASLPLSAKNWAECKEQSDLRSAQSLASCRRSGCSPAVPYPPHEYLQSTISSYLPLPKVTSLLCRKGDISILH